MEISANGGKSTLAARTNLLAVRFEASAVPRDARLANRLSDRRRIVPMFRKSGIAFAVFVALTLTVAMVAAVSNAHFVGTPTYTISGNTLTVNGKVAGLGDVDVITVTVSADAACINPGTKHPKAANKESFSSSENVPVQNGKADFSADLTATFTPDCTPPMSVVWSNIVVTVTAIDGTYLQYRF
jgi:hypothetical protein